jgi:hypothetical protein
VDHEIEHDVYVRTALAIRRQTVTLDEARRPEIRLGGQNGGVEALQMPDLQYPAARTRELYQLARLRGRLGDRLLDEDMRASVVEIACDAELRRRRLAAKELSWA